MKYIYLTNGGKCKTDDADYKELSKFNWQKSKLGYAVRCKTFSSGVYKEILMHRELLELVRGQITDHINRDRLDNRRSNLRVVNYNQNNRNKSKQSNNTSGFIGVTKQRNRWKAYIYYNNFRHHLVEVDDKIEAAYIRDQFALQLHGEFANTNFEYA